MLAACRPGRGLLLPLLGLASPPEPRAGACQWTQGGAQTGIRKCGWKATADSPGDLGWSPFPVCIWLLVHTTVTASLRPVLLCGGGWAAGALGVGGSNQPGSQGGRLVQDGGVGGRRARRATLVPQVRGWCGAPIRPCPERLPPSLLPWRPVALGAAGLAQVRCP